MYSTSRLRKLKIYRRTDLAADCGTVQACTVSAGACPTMSGRCLTNVRARGIMR